MALINKIKFWQKKEKSPTSNTKNGIEQLEKRILELEERRKNRNKDKQFKQKITSHTQQLTEKILLLEQEGQENLEKIEKKFQQLEQEQQSDQELQKLRSEIEKIKTEKQEIQQKISQIKNIKEEVRDLRKIQKENYRHFTREIDRLNSAKTTQNKTQPSKTKRPIPEKESETLETSQDHEHQVSDITQRDDLTVKEKMMAIIIKRVDEGKKKTEIKDEILDKENLGSRSYFYNVWNKLKEMQYIDDGKLTVNKNQAVEQIQDGSIEF